MLEEENKIIALKKAINNGIESGIADNFNPKQHLESLKAKKGRCLNFILLKRQHIIFHSIANDDEIEIIRFLHSRMDLKNKIQE